ncbi:MAG: peptide-methionine (S)-S-oxide reductase MsrA [Candidatus Pacearchaeota archaeon]|nr:peptide-methionine (S)-S-oxide reductase MsrA [Candidatus Pacearchaeota archaeon]
MIKTIYFGAGCFWGAEQAFDSMSLGLKTKVGYMGGDENKFPNPTYKDVCSNETGYIEVIKIEYEENKVSFEELLDKFWNIHDPTSMDRQGADKGYQYKSVIFFTDKEQEKIAKESLEKRQKIIGKKIVTEIKNAQTFYEAEEYHQKYYLTHNVSCNI